MQFPHLVTSFFYETGIFVSRTNQQQQKKLILSRMTSSTAGADDGKVRPKKVKRRQFVGLAKAVDRGQFATVYQPLGKDGTFTALSGLPNTAVPFTVLGIESSCDDTGAAIVRSDGAILGECLASQNHVHEKWGGVVPNLAREAHIQKIDLVVEEALRKANMTIHDVSAIGVTVGPGLEVCLRVGCNKAKALAMAYNKPFVAVHHLEAHILMARIPCATSNTPVCLPPTNELHGTTQTLDFPFLALLVSGGHCQLLKCLGVGKYVILGGTIDDSLGEAFDKVARVLGLPVGGGGGPAVERLAKFGDPSLFPLPVPMANRPDCDFSYSGLKTSVRVAMLNLRKERGLIDDADELSHQDKANIAASFQNVAICHLEQRLRRCMKMLDETSDIRSLAVVGGVAANTELRNRLQALCEKRRWRMFVPPPRLCTDQGAMSAWAAIERIMVGSSDDPSNQEVFARFPFADIFASDEASRAQAAAS